MSQMPPAPPGAGGVTPQPGHCPGCGSNQFKVPTFTWWGGMIGQKIIGYAKCQQCGKGFNRKTGGEATAGIVVYTIVVTVVLFGLFGCLGAVVLPNL